MPADRSELSSLATLLGQLTQRIASMGESSAAAHADDEAKELFGIERSLAGAMRRLERLLNARR